MLSYKEFRLNEAAKLSKIKIANLPLEEKYAYLKSTLNIVKEYPDCSLDVDGDIKFADMKLTEIPFKFNKVSGTFDIYNNKISSLVGAPVECKTFMCNKNKITNLKFSPKIVEDFHCSFNKLQTLEGSPSKCRSFSCSHNKITNLIGGPSSVTYYKCNDNPLESLEGAPHNKCQFEFNGSYNLLYSIANKEYLKFFEYSHIVINKQVLDDTRKNEIIKYIILNEEDPSNKEFYDKAKVLDLF